MSPQGSDSGPLARAVGIQAERGKPPDQSYVLCALRYPRPFSRDGAGQSLDNLTAFPSSSGGAWSEVARRPEGPRNG